jgi:rubrerythrin
MIQYLNEDEVYRVGMCMEQAGLDFYTAMAAKSDDPATKRVFRRLAEDERNHLALFESLELATPQGMGAIPEDLDEDISRYVCSIVDGGIFKSLAAMGEVAKRKFDPKKALELALQVEKDAVLYYSEAYRQNPKLVSREAIARLIDEEKRHVVEISKRLEAVRRKKPPAQKAAPKKAK